ncbi:MAG: hypothetical protein UZ17_ACD001001780 [Acidobacteria bacterium OLB17]|nr:MAG: hypothetical protein UZ17_ACD001001780 [Acidobacteria bacterium OLB17]MCZ2390640.1 hypothetical protein [Acidobacteriota bacterium]
MYTFSELISRTIVPEAKGRHKPIVHTLSSRIEPKTKQAPGVYEAEVFSFLFANKEELGIKAVMKFTALLVDGAVELTDGTRLAVEVKFRMNWQKACQAEWQFRTFLRMDARPFPVAGGVVIFQEFQGDWQRQAASRLLLNGWTEWYQGHADVDGFRLDLLRFHAGILEGF